MGLFLLDGLSPSFPWRSSWEPSIPPWEDKEKKVLLRHDQIYQGLGEQMKRVFQVHEVQLVAIKEWQDLGGKLFLSRAL